MLTLNKLCTCDHSEIPTKISGEDLEFSKLSLITLGRENPILVIKKVPAPTCHQSTNSEDLSHSATPTEPHICPHEKSSQNVENIAAALNAINCVETEIVIEPKYHTVLTISYDFGHSLPDHSSPPFEPPRLC